MPVDQSGAALGNAITNGFKLARDEVNARGKVRIDLVIEDSSGKQVGVVLTLNDVTEQVGNERTTLWILALVTALVFVGSFLVTAAYLRVEVIGPLVHLTAQAKEISMGNVELKLETDREDEIGLLIKAFERMRVSLKKSLAMLTR